MPRASRPRSRGYRIAYSFILSSLRMQRALLRWLVAGNIVSLDPPRRADREAGLGAGGNLARRLDIAAHEGGLGGGEIRPRKVVLLRVGHGKLCIAVGRFRLAQQRRLQN